MEKMVYKAIIRYLKKHYPGELDKIVKRAKESLPELKAKAPDLGGRENTLANNMDLTELGCPELNVLFCENDVHSYGNLPGLKFTRTKTIGAGDDLCDFKMEIVQRG